MTNTAMSRPDFHITHEETPSEVLIAGFSSFGLAGLTAVDFIVDHLELEETGHLTVEGLPSVTPFLEGRPRHHTRLFSRPDIDVTILVGELFVPAESGAQFSNAILDWMEGHGVGEIAVLNGIPIAHGPDEHRVYYVATDDYRAARLQSADIPPMGRGFFGGTNAALVERGIESPLGVGVYITPVHAQVPDVEAAIRLVDAVNDVYDLGVDSHPLESFAENVHQYYTELADRLEESESDLPDDRMFM
ncbi:proteasome assembly chaperone family protein [Haloferax sp. MBLA0076]|uniref:Proteasome assembly chaperone family protein n=1 Tax=Haloferax litoreum TaxID=2666140 RepID=A0A6A8GGR7_9EURY|nr:MULTISPECIES: PAC2 family protein [Haloferax]KAB1193823.1 proteasome assembly chaperone family protein [Haloferax sp. CBA1148]MRX22365.1 proteasome assembly chaperone family protein [Haloferax litoreum]